MLTGERSGAAARGADRDRAALGMRGWSSSACILLRMRGGKESKQEQKHMPGLLSGQLGAL